MKQYINPITNEIIPHNKIEIVVDNKYYLCPPEDILLEEGWVLYEKEEDVKPVPKKEYPNAIELFKQEKIRQLLVHDKSIDVNSFFVGDIQAWIDRDTRVSLMNTVKIRKELGKETSTLWLDNTPFEINCDLMIQMLYSLEEYAFECYNVTETHKSEISKLETIKDIQDYNFKINYPEKLIFNV